MINLFRHRVLGPIFLSVAAGCVTSSTGISIGARGLLNMKILADRESPTASLTAFVGLSESGTNLFLEDDQTLAVNGAVLSPVPFGFGKLAATVTAVDPPDRYVISFDDKGTVGTMAVTPPADLIEITAPAGNARVSLLGFTVTWPPSDETDVMVTISIDEAVVLTVPDDGLATLDEAALERFGPGRHAVTVSRLRTEPVPADLGFTGGEVVVGSEDEVIVTFQE